MAHDSTSGLSGRPPRDVTTIVDDSPLAVARQNVHAVQGQLLAAEVALERKYDAPSPDGELAHSEAEIARLRSRLEQRLIELNAIEEAAGLPLTTAGDGIDDPAPRRQRLARLREQRMRAKGA